MSGRKGVDMLKEQRGHFVEAPFTKDMIAVAKKRAGELGSLKDSIRKGQGNFVGYLGELAVAEYIGAERHDTYNSDLKKDGITIEVKTKQCSSKPTLDYEASIAITSKKQRPNMYMFTRIEMNKGEVIAIWLCGQISYEDYFRKARFLEKGDKDPQPNNPDWKVKQSCYNLIYRDLNKITPNSPNDLGEREVERLLVEGTDDIVQYIDWKDYTEEIKERKRNWTPLPTSVQTVRSNGMREPFKN